MEPLCILVADDDTDIVNAVRLYLEKEGFTVFGAANGLEALDILEKETIHAHSAKAQSAHSGDER